MGNKILYLDSRQSRTVMKALRKYGMVEHAHDISQALLLMAEKDFNYFFVDADTPQAHAFLKHLEHDPTLPPPSGVVLLTDNEEEDCEAWSVDAFITRSRIHGDVAYVFSHHKVEQPEHANVLPIAGRADVHRIAAPGEMKGTWDRGSHETEARAGEKFNSAKRAEQSVKRDYGITEGANRRYRFVLVALLITALGLWLFVWGPFAGNKARDRRRADSSKVEAESSAKKREGNFLLGSLPNVPVNYASSTATVGQSAPAVNAAAAESPTVGQQPAAAAEQPAAASSSSDGKETAAIPEQQPPANHPPTVGISGPGQVTSRQTATYTASGSDPDGDGISYSWGGSTVTRCWSTPGLYTVSVTVTDSRGASAGASISVRVI